MAFWSKDPLVREMIEELDKPSLLPGKALRYQKLRELLLQDLALLESRFLPRRRRSEQVRRLRRRFEGLQSLERELHSLFEECGTVAENVVRLADEASRLGRRGEALQERCKAWTGTVGRLGENVGRSAEALQDRAALKDIAEEVNLQIELVRLFRQADQMLARLPEGGDREAFSQELESRRRRWTHGQVDWPWLDELGKWLAGHLRPSPEAPPPAPSGESAVGAQEEASEGIDHSVVDLLEEARGWSRELGIGPEPMLRLRDRFGIPPVSWEAWDRPEAEKYGEAVERMVEDLRRQATEQRDLRRAQLQEYLNQYTGIRGEDANLEREINRLDLSVDTPGRHSRWLAVAQEVLSRFKGTAGVHRNELKASVEQRRQELDESLNGFASRPLFGEDQTVLAGLRRRTNQIADPEDLEEILEAVIECGRLEREYLQLEQSAKQRLELFEQRCARLGERQRHLTEAAAQAGSELRPPSYPVDDLRQRDQSEGRDEVRRRVEIVERDLEDEEGRLLEICRDKILRSRRVCRGIWAALEGLGVSPPADGPSAEVDSLDNLESALALLGEFSQLESKAESWLEESIDLLKKRRLEVRRDLEALPVSNPYDRERLSGHLSPIFDDGAWEGIDDRLTLLKKLQTAVEQGEGHRDSFYRNHRIVEGLREELPRRLTVFEGEGLRRYAPESVYDRITALIEGIPPSPGDWAAAVDQLQEAEQLINRLERHARRVQSAEG